MGLIEVKEVLRLEVELGFIETKIEHLLCFERSLA
jgi:hypothetical protein